jgi:hypothetical protein
MQDSKITPDAEELAAKPKSFKGNALVQGLILRPKAKPQSIIQRWSHSSGPESRRSNGGNRSPSNSRLKLKLSCTGALKKLRPRTLLYTIFAFIELCMLAAFLAAGAAAASAMRENYRASARDTLDSVSQAVSKQVRNQMLNIFIYGLQCIHQQ